MQESIFPSGLHCTLWELNPGCYFVRPLHIPLEHSPSLTYCRSRTTSSLGVSACMPDCSTSLRTGLQHFIAHGQHLIAHGQHFIVHGGGALGHW